MRVGSNQRTAWIRGHLEDLVVAVQVNNFPDFMESRYALLCSNELAIGPCAEPNESGPHPSIIFILRFILVVSGPSTLRSPKRETKTMRSHKAIPRQFSDR